MLAAGLCRSDIAVTGWPEDQMPCRLPMTLAHEGVGRVADIGDGVEGVTAGDVVAVHGPWGCGRCRTFAQGQEQYCERAAAEGIVPPGLGRDGALAQHILVDDARHLVPLDDLDPVEAVSLTDAGPTPHHAIKTALPQLTPGSTAVVIGTGGLGHVAIQVLRVLTPARVIALDVDEQKLDLARTVGAHEALLSDESAAGKIREMADGRGAQGVFDLACAGAIDLHVERYGIDEAPEAHARLHDGKVNGRAVVVPG